MRHDPVSRDAVATAPVAPVQEQVDGADGYPLEVRVWRPESPRASLVMLHGIVSHSGWLDPIASRLAGRGIEVICPDRRGSGRSTLHRGDAPSAAALLGDLDRILDRYREPGIPQHLCGFCWGAVYAVRYLAVERPPLHSLILLAPGLYPTEVLTRVPLITGDSSEPTLDPLVPLHGFTQGAALHEFILPDPLRLRSVSPRFNSIVAEFSRLITPRIARLRLPTLCVLAEDDRITDNEATRTAFARVRADPHVLALVPGEHGVQFDSPDQSAELIEEWIASGHHCRRP